MTPEEAITVQSCSGCGIRLPKWHFFDPRYPGRGNCKLVKTTCHACRIRNLYTQPGRLELREEDDVIQEVREKHGKWLGQVRPYVPDVGDQQEVLDKLERNIREKYQRPPAMPSQPATNRSTIKRKRGGNGQAPPSDEAAAQPAPASSSISKTETETETETRASVTRLPSSEQERVTSTDIETLQTILPRDMLRNMAADGWAALKNDKTLEAVREYTELILEGQGLRRGLDMLKNKWSTLRRIEKATNIEDKKMHELNAEQQEARHQLVSKLSQISSIKERIAVVRNATWELRQTLVTMVDDLH